MKQYISGFIGDEGISNQKLNAKVGDFRPTSQVMTDKGLLCKDAVLALAPQVREYHPSEIGLTNWPKEVIRLYTPPDVLFSPDLMDNINEVADNHPKNNQLTPDNWKQFVIGTVSNRYRAGDELRGDLLVKDAVAIKNIKEKKKVELSIGYEFNAELTAGTTENGEPYDAIITSMKGDHVALVKVARGGKRVRIGDEQKQERNLVKVKLKMANGQVWEVEVEGNAEAFQAAFDADQSALKQAQDKLNTDVQVGDQTFKAGDTIAIQAAFTALKNQSAADKTEIEELKKNSVNTEDLEKLSAERAQTISEAKNLKPDLDPSGKTLDEIISEAVTAHGEDASVKAVLEGAAIGDALPERLHIAFQVLSATKPKATVNNKVGDSSTAEVLKNLGKESSPADARKLISESKTNAWKGVQK